MMKTILLKHKYCCLAGLLAAAVVLVMSACTGQAGPAADTLAEPTPTPTAKPSLRGIGDTLQIYYWQAPTILNPHLTTNLKDWDASRITYEPLASFDQEGNLVPFLAAEIPSLENGDVAADGLSVTWRLKPGLRWSDGEPFSANDVQFTYQYISNPQVQSASLPAYEAVKDVQVIDDDTVKVNFKEVNPAWSLPFVGVQGSILPRHVFESYNGPNAQAASANMLPVGTGPYRVVKFQTEAFLILDNDLVETKKIVYEPNPYFREEDKPFFSRVELKGGGDAEEAALSALQIGDVDYAWNLQLDATELSRLQEMGKGQVVANLGPRIERILLNRSDPDKLEGGTRSNPDTVNPRLSDKKVRQALTYVIDREAVAALSGPADTATSNNLISPARYNSPNTSYEFNLSKAAALLDEAGWVDSDGDGIRDKNGVKLSLTFQTTINPLRQKIQEMARKNLAEIGVEVKLEVIDASIFFGNVTRAPTPAVT
jgi:peptide/nickel transport system substrate-binding protein